MLTPPEAKKNSLGSNDNERRKNKYPIDETVKFPAQSNNEQEWRPDRLAYLVLSAMKPLMENRSLQGCTDTKMCIPYKNKKQKTTKTQKLRVVHTELNIFI